MNLLCPGFANPAQSISPGVGNPGKYFFTDLVNRVKEDGRAFLSSTTIDGTIYIRLAVLSFRTHLSTINRCLDVLKELTQGAQA